MLLTPGCLQSPPVSPSLPGALLSQAEAGSLPSNPPGPEHQLPPCSLRASLRVPVTSRLQLRPCSCLCHIWTGSGFALHGGGGASTHPGQAERLGRVGVSGRRASPAAIVEGWGHPFPAGPHLGAGVSPGPQCAGRCTQGPDMASLPESPAVVTEALAARGTGARHQVGLPVGCGLRARLSADFQLVLCTRACKPLALNVRPHQDGGGAGTPPAEGTAGPRGWFGGPAFQAACRIWVSARSFWLELHARAAPPTRPSSSGAHLTHKQNPPPTLTHELPGLCRNAGHTPATRAHLPGLPPALSTPPLTATGHSPTQRGLPTSPTGVAERPRPGRRPFPQEDTACNPSPPLKQTLPPHHIVPKSRSKNSVQTSIGILFLCRIFFLVDSLFFFLVLQQTLQI